MLYFSSNLAMNISHFSGVILEKGYQCVWKSSGILLSFLNSVETNTKPLSLYFVPKPCVDLEEPIFVHCCHLGISWKKPSSRQFNAHERWWGNSTIFSNQSFKVQVLGFTLSKWPVSLRVSDLYLFSPSKLNLTREYKSSGILQNNNHVECYDELKGMKLCLAYHRNQGDTSLWCLPRKKVLFCSVCFLPGKCM